MYPPALVSFPPRRRTDNVILDLGFSALHCHPFRGVRRGTRYRAGGGAGLREVEDRVVEEQTKRQSVNQIRAKISTSCCCLTRPSVLATHFCCVVCHARFFLSLPPPTHPPIANFIDTLQFTVSKVSLSARNPQYACFVSTLATLPAP
jgi:hypothetical protein